LRGRGSVDVPVLKRDGIRLWWYNVEIRVWLIDGCDLVRQIGFGGGFGGGDGWYVDR